MIKAALFDLDGVLIDTETLYTEFWHGLGQSRNVGIDDFAQRIKGTTISDILATYFPPSQHEAILAELKNFEANMRYSLFPGVADFLGSIRRAGIKAAIVTSSNDAKMQRLWEQLPGLRQWFDAVITDSMVERSKPDPQPYQVAAAALGEKSGDCCVFEDSFSGIESGRRSGARVVALSTTNPQSSLIGKADLVAPSLQSLSVEQLRDLWRRDPSGRVS